MNIKNNVTIQKQERLYPNNNILQSKKETVNHLEEALEIYYENDDMIKKLKQSEKEIENGEGIELDVALERLRHKYGY